jgi:drug/metabolite transporter (DMT)-like permease
MNHKSWKGHIAAIFCIFVWGTTFISTKVLLKTFSPIEILFIRFIIGYTALWLAFPHRLRLSERKHELYFAAAGLCGVTLYFLFENIALTFTLVSNVGVIVSLSPFFAAILASIFLHGERPGLRFFLGFVIAMIGIYLISFRNTSEVNINPWVIFLP